MLGRDFNPEPAEHEPIESRVWNVIFTYAVDTSFSKNMSVASVPDDNDGLTLGKQVALRSGHPCVAFQRCEVRGGETCNGSFTLACLIPFGGQECCWALGASQLLEFRSHNAFITVISLSRPENL